LIPGITEVLSIFANSAENPFKRRLIKGWRMFLPTATRVDQTEWGGKRVVMKKDD
jgi:hypothetical protein